MKESKSGGGETRETRVGNIKVTCPNGHIFWVPQSQAGKKVQCPTCREWVEVPES